MNNQIKICGHYYDIKFVDGLADASGDRHVWGRIHPGRQIIEIELDSTVSKKQEALIHEILHAIESSVDLGLKEIECVVCTTKAGAENSGINDCARYILVTAEGDTAGSVNNPINTDLRYDSNVAASLPDATDNTNEVLDTTEEIITRDATNTDVQT